MYNILCFSILYCILHYYTTIRLYYYTVRWVQQPGSGSVGLGLEPGCSGRARARAHLKVSRARTPAPIVLSLTAELTA